MEPESEGTVVRQRSGEETIRVRRWLDNSLHRHPTRCGGIRIPCHSQCGGTVWETISDSSTAILNSQSSPRFGCRRACGFSARRTVLDALSPLLPGNTSSRFIFEALDHFTCILPLCNQRCGFNLFRQVRAADQILGCLPLLLMFALDAANLKSTCTVFP